jgi:hypothetical protein
MSEVGEHCEHTGCLQTLTFFCGTTRCDAGQNNQTYNLCEETMKKIIIATLAAAGLGGCIAVPAPYYGGGGYYPAPAPAVAVGVYPPPVYYGGYGYGYRGRAYRRW